jgi:glycosyltransferase involved in cell wall biosynthesis
MAVIGVPLYNRAEYLPHAMTSLLAQSYERVRFVLIDDASTDTTTSIACDLADRDPRIHFERNERRLGLVGNWARCFARARELHPQVKYFAWASDHDVWDIDWLQRLVEVLETQPTAVLAYPRSQWLMGDGGAIQRPQNRLEVTAGTAIRLRLWETARRMSAGSMVYGLFRYEALAATSGYRSVLEPDRLLLAEASLQGGICYVPLALWTRRFPKTATRTRQRASIFPAGAPIYSYLSPHLTHVAALTWWYTVRGAGGPAITRAEGLVAAASYGLAITERSVRKRSRRLVKALKRLRKNIVPYRKAARRAWRRLKQRLGRTIGRGPSTRP